jgi:hypothetical protein
MTELGRDLMAHFTNTSMVGSFMGFIFFSLQL